MKVLVIVVTYNFCPWMEQCLSSVDSTRYDIMVIDNASTDDTVAEIRAHYPDVILVYSDENLGFGQANNIGLRYALQNGYDYTLLLNQDAWLLPDTIEKLIGIQQQNPDYWVISPMQYNSLQGGLESQFAVYCNRFGVPVQGRTDLYPVEFVNAAVWLVPTQYIELVGGFDPFFPHYGEDTDFLQRICYHGGKVGIYTGAIAYHERRKATSSEYGSKLLYKTELVYFNIVKDINHSLPIAYLYLFRYSALHILKYVLTGRFQQARINLKAWHKSMISMAKIRTHRIISKQHGAFL